MRLSGQIELSNQAMNNLAISLALLLMFTAPAFAAAGSSSRQEPQSRQHEYWLSHDMQRLVFWQSPSQGSTSRR